MIGGEETLTMGYSARSTITTVVTNSAGMSCAVIRMPRLRQLQPEVAACGFVEALHACFFLLPFFLFVSPGLFVWNRGWINQPVTVVIVLKQSIIGQTAVRLALELYSDPPLRGTTTTAVLLLCGNPVKNNTNDILDDTFVHVPKDREKTY